MAAVLNKRCPRNHQQQQLPGGRCTRAAFYPLGLIREMLTGMRNTAIAEDALINTRADEREAMNAVMNSMEKIPWASGIIADDSTVKLLRGWTLPVGYKSNNFKPHYVDEYTGETLSL